jgi:pimeloyl-ACP methyl ester carboxylesterase
MTSTGESAGADTIVLIHGLWMTPLSWEKWIDRYEGKGFNVIAPGWPGIDGDPAALRRDPTPIAQLGVEEIADHYEEIIRKLDRPPIIMGHSFGGLITQILLDRGLGSAGVAIDPAAPRGVFKLPFSQLRVGFAALRNPANKRKAVALTPKQFHYAFTNTLSDKDSQAVYERYAIPGPGRPLFEAAFSGFHRNSPTKVNFHNDSRAPLLLIAGGQDHTAPAAVTRSNLKLQRKSKATTDYREFPNRSHFTVGQDGWEEVADYALQWATEHARVPVAV